MTEVPPRSRDLADVLFFTRRLELHQFIHFYTHITLTIKWTLTNGSNTTLTRSHQRLQYSLQYAQPAFSRSTSQRPCWQPALWHHVADLATPLEWPTGSPLPYDYDSLDDPLAFAHQLAIKIALPDHLYNLSLPPALPLLLYLEP